MRIHSLFAFITLVILGFTFAFPTSALTLSSGDLIKGPGDTVYYYAADGKRYVFPTAKTYFSWYTNFDAVKTISASELQVLPLGGNVTYRPGAKLVKITTDPKVYAVTEHGTLRWVTTETIAQTLYGPDWNTKVDDIPDAFFINYKIGVAIQSAGEFSPSQEMALIPTINIDKYLGPVLDPVYPAPTPTPNPTPTSTVSELTFTASKSPVAAGDIETLTAQVANGIAVSKIELFFDGALIQSCSSISCTGDIQVPVAGTKSSYVAEARATKTSQEVLSKTLTIPVQSSSTSLVHLKVGRAQITSNQLASVSAEADAKIAVNRIDIYVDGTAVKGCINGVRLCQWSDYLQGSVSSVHPVSAVVTDTLGRTYTSKTLTITIATNDSPSVTVEVAKPTIYAGETVDVTVSGSDNDGIAWIEVLKDGVVIKHCESSAPCKVTTGPWMDAGTVLQFSGKASDPKQMVGTGDTQNVSVIQK